MGKGHDQATCRILQITNKQMTKRIFNLTGSQAYIHFKIPDCPSN